MRTPRLLTSLLTGTALALSTASVASAAECTPLPTTKAFDQVDGDKADYTVAPGGGFEYGAQPWKLTGAARVVVGNEPLGIRPGYRSLRLPLGSSATSPEFCVDKTKPHFRFAFKVDNAWLAGFVALVIHRNAGGEVTNVELTSSKRTTLTPTRWQATDPSPLATLLPLDDDQTATVQVKILSLIPADFVDDLMTRIAGENRYREAMLNAQAIYEQTLAAAWSPFANIGVTVDAVMVDPYRRG